ncbi:MAG: 3-hydroxybutyryl-CoA dehydrogenase [Holosporales bacterium]
MFSFVNVQDVGVIGSGQMGQGIAQIFALSGFRVNLIDSSEDALKKGIVNIYNSTEKLHKKGLISDIDCLQNIKTSTDLDDVLSAQLIIEAIPEDLHLKVRLFQDIEEIIKDKSLILATNTSSFSISKIQEHLKFKERFLGLHFMNPVIFMPLVEVIMGEKSHNTLLAVVNPIIQSIKKTPIVVKDSPGFVLNRILIPMINEACLVLDENIASIEDINMSLKLGAKFPMGPLELADYIGLDTVLAIMEELQNGFGNRFKIATCLKQRILDGKLGKKSGEGFLKYA